MPHGLANHFLGTLGNVALGHGCSVKFLYEDCCVPCCLFIEVLSIQGCAHVHACQLWIRSWTTQGCIRIQTQHDYWGIILPVPACTCDQEKAAFDEDLFKILKVMVKGHTAFAFANITAKLFKAGRWILPTRTDVSGAYSFSRLRETNFSISFLLNVLFNFRCFKMAVRTKTELLLLIINMQLC